MKLKNVDDLFDMMDEAAKERGEAAKREVLRRVRAALTDEDDVDLLDEVLGSADTTAGVWVLVDVCLRIAEDK